jgi:L-rhamnose isomerase / sugar isomerase
MEIQKEQILECNKNGLKSHQENVDFLANKLSKQGVSVSTIIAKLADFQVAIPSWALGAGGTRFGRFSFYGEPTNLHQKIEDIGVLHSLTQTAGAVSLHIPWDIPSDYAAIKEHANALNIKFDSVNSNTFQDQKNAAESYKYGSLSNVAKAVREQAIQHNLDVINIGNKLGSKSLTVWLADGSCFPGQNNFQTALQNTQDSLQSIYKGLPNDWSMLIEYKPYEPNFYSTVIQDWGTSFMLANECGEKAFTLVDLGHHLPNSNIEQIVSILMLKGKLGGFHFNDSKYGDDDLTVGSIKPYALFLIFNELVYGMQNNPQNPDLAWMIDASHNVKDPLEDLIQSLEAIQEAYAKALLVDQNALKNAQLENDVVLCQEILQGAYRTDVRPLLAEARLISGGVLNPIQAFRSLNVRGQLIKERGKNTIATGL